MLLCPRLLVALPLLAALVGPPPVSAQLTRGPTPCSVAVGVDQARADERVTAATHARGLEMRLVQRCSGFSVFIQGGVAETVAADYARLAERAYGRLAEESGELLSPAAVLFVFVDQDGMAEAEQILTGRTVDSGDARRGYTSNNTVWIDDSQHPTPADRAQALLHEFTHLFATLLMRGHEVPVWFNEGLAANSEVTLAADLFPVAAEMRAALYRSYVLDAISQRFPRPLFELDEIATNADWQSHFADADDMVLQYGQAYHLVRAAIAERGRAAAWALLRDVGNGTSFDAAFRAAFGRSVPVADALTRGAWQADAGREPDRLQLTVRVAAGSGAEVSLLAALDRRATRASGIVAGGSVLSFEVPSDGSLVQTSGELAVSQAEVDQTEAGFGPHVTVTLRRAGDIAEQVVLDRDYGRWAPHQPGLVVHQADGTLEWLAGPLSNAFPSGDAVEAVYPRQ